MQDRKEKANRQEDECEVIWKYSAVFKTPKLWEVNSLTYQT